MDARLQYSMEELHDMHKRILMNAVMSKHQADGAMIDNATLGVFCDDAERLINILGERGFIKNE